MAETPSFDKQYCASYLARYAMLEREINTGLASSGQSLAVKELKDDLAERCVVIGIFFLNSKAKESVLTGSPRAEETYIDDSAEYLIEDRSGRLKVVFADGFAKLPALMSGMVLGFVGCLGPNASFICDDIVFPAAIPRFASHGPGSKGQVLLISNCLISRNGIDRMKMIVDYCRDRTTEIVLVGDLFGAADSQPQTDLLGAWASDAGVRVNVVPGLGDPTTQSYPQLPLHKLLFKKGVVESPQGASAGTVVPQPNPSTMQISGLSCIAFSHYLLEDMAKYVPRPADSVYTTLSRNTDDAKRYVSPALTLDILEQLLRIRHLAPNAPDTLGCVPYADTDPFIISQCDYLLVGGCVEPCSRTCDGTKIVGIPDFDLTGIALLVDLASGAIEEIECPSGAIEAC